MTIYSGVVLHLSRDTSTLAPILASWPGVVASEQPDDPRKLVLVLAGETEEEVTGVMAELGRQDGVVGVYPVYIHYDQEGDVS